jgi:FecR protein.
MRTRLSRQVFGAVLLALLRPASEAAASSAGVVTGVSGQVTVSRTEASPLPLRFKDEVFLKDRISTAERSLARLLLDQKALITVRELSDLVITEQSGRSTVELGAGKIAIGVARQRMRPGEIVEIRTQNAVAAIRGTVVVAENIPVPPGAPPQSRIHVLSGFVDITPRNNPGAAPVRMVAPASLSVAGQSVGVPVPLSEAAGGTSY